MVVTFELERFEWAAPDRLQVAGTFGGLGDASAGDPALVVRGAERTHRLTAADGATPSDGQPWTGVFVWTEPPEAFDTAELRLGEDVAVELPEPRPGQRPFGDQRLDVHHPQPQEEGSSNGTSGGAAERLRLQGELVAAREEAREQRAAAERAQADLARAVEDLQSERERHAAEAERFRSDLAGLRASAEEALTAEHAGTEDLHTQLDAALAARAEAESAAEALREGLSVLQDVEARNQQLTAELELARVQSDAAVARRDEVRGTMGEVRSEAERLLARLTEIEDALGDGG